MYVRRTAMPGRFPPNYHGNLVADNKDDHETDQRLEKNERQNNRHEAVHKYKVRKNICRHSKKDTDNSLLKNASNDDLLLLGLIVFLYVGCEHSKENLMLMGALAYLLLGSKGDGKSC
ncbi:MAG: hypothetical protein IJ391_03765 [Clostridia bacterium]|nr:hypothetical protein [Clostridia bacterium]